MAFTRRPAAAKKWEKDGLLLALVRHPSLGHFCGYVNFPKRPTIEQGYEGILTYVPVHGGITYAAEEKDGTFTYGFDCMHVDDDDDPRCADIDWLTRETELMATAIRVAATYEQRYLLAASNEDKAAVIDAMHKEMERDHEIRFSVTDNFGTMLRLFGGEL